MAKPKVFIGVGHGGNDPGAVKYVREEDVNLQISLACRDYLEANGVQVKLSRTKDENDPLEEEIRECNAFNPDLAVDNHVNAGKGDGFEAFHHYRGGIGKILAENIEKEIKKIGQNSRGCKTKIGANGQDYFGFIRETVCPAVITESFFVDNKIDVKIGDTVAEQKAIGVAIAKGILATLEEMGKLKTTVKKETVKKTENKKTSKSYLVKITADVLNVRAGAGKNYKVNTTIKYNEVYTIVDEKNGWGKLKSGAGWISLEYTKKV